MTSFPGKDDISALIIPFFNFFWPRYDVISGKRRHFDANYTFFFFYLFGPRYDVISVKRRHFDANYTFFTFLSLDMTSFPGKHDISALIIPFFTFLGLDMTSFSGKVDISVLIIPFFFYLLGL